MVGYRNFASNSSATDGSSLQRRNEFHLTKKPYLSYNGSNFKAQNQRGSNPQSSKSNLENGLNNNLKFRMIVRRIGAGLENLGNTCFLNSVLQCLTYTEPLVAYLLSGKHQSSCHVVGFCALCAIQNHVSRALQYTGRILAPKELVSNLRRISQNFRTSRQEDAHEYMIHLLESMHKCCLPSGVPYESPNAYEKSLVHKIFGGSLRSQIKCMQCSYGSNKFDPFLDLSLEIVKADSLHKALGHFTAAEQLDGGEKQYMCQQCKQKVRAVKQLTIDKAPYVLTIHLKRFGSHISGQKIDKKVHFGPILDLKSYVSGSHGGQLKYTLYGVLVHAGWSTHSGHYYCFVRTSSGIWYSLDDNRVRQVSEKIVLEQKAYMLFYVRDGVNFGAGNIANAIQSQKMIPAFISSSTTSYTPANAITQKDEALETMTAQKEKQVAAANEVKEVETAVENGPCSSAKCQEFQSNVKVKAEASNDSNGDAQQNLPYECLLAKDLSNRDSPRKPDSQILSRLSMESKGNDSELIRNIQHSTSPSKCVLEALHPVTCDDKTVKIDPLSSVPNPSEQLATIAQKASDKAEGAPQKIAVENNCSPSSRSNGKDGLLSNSLCEITPKKPKRKAVEYKFTRMQLSTRILYGAPLSLQKRKKHKKTRIVEKKLDAENAMHKKSGPSTSHATEAIDVFPKKSRNRSRRGKKQSIVDHSKLDSICTWELKKGITSGNIVLAGKSAEMHQQLQDRSTSVEKDSLNTIDGVTSEPTKNLKRTSVEICNAVEHLSSQICNAGVSIGYVADEWDKEYDRGKRKKVKKFKEPFGGANLFPKSTTKAGKFKGKRKQYNRVNQPVAELGIIIRRD